MALADYAKMAFSPANVGVQTVNLADEVLANVEGNATVNVDSSAPVSISHGRSNSSLVLQQNLESNANGGHPRSRRQYIPQGPGSYNNNVGLEI